MYDIGYLKAMLININKTVNHRMEMNMVIGTGIDIIEVGRIANASSRPAFLERLFTDVERSSFRVKNNDPQTIAGMFAAKEASFKALSSGFDSIDWKDIEIVHDETGKPNVTLHDTATRRMKALGGSEIHISISHIKELAIAQAILVG